MSHKKIHFTSIRLADVDDPDVYLMLAINKFLDTTKGKWIKENAQDLEYSVEQDGFGGNHLRCVITGMLTDIQATEYILRWKE